MTRARGAYLASACLAVYYAASMSRDLSLYDSGELALAARTLGLGHPAGQPLHTLVGYVFSQLAGSARSALFWINLASALPAALTLIPAAAIADVLTRTRVPRQQRSWQPWLVALFALHASVWEPVSRVEVYALATCCALWAIAHTLPLFSPAHAVVSPQKLCFTGLRAGVALGLAACANPVIAAAAGCALAPGLLQVAWSQRALGPVIGCSVLGGVIGLLPYVYLPLVATYSQAMLWGAPHTRDEYLRYLTLRDYAGNRTLGFSGWLEHVWAWCEWATRHLLTPTLILGLAGFVRARLRSPAARWVFAIALACMVANVSSNSVWNLEIPDYNGYLALGYWLAAAGAAAFATNCVEQRRYVAGAAIVLCLVAGWACPPQPWARTRHRDDLARALAEQVLREAPKGAIVISHADYFAGSLFYLQEAEGQRPDVVVLAYGLASSSWHWRHIARRHPQLVASELRPGSARAARVQSWLRANAVRPVLVENLGIASALQLTACPGGLYLLTGAACSAAARPEPVARELLARELTKLGHGSPDAAEAIAQVSEQLGSAWWRLGWAREAHDLLLAGVPQNAQPRIVDAAQALVGRMQAPPPIWRKHAALGDPARNLYLAGAIVFASGNDEDARRYVQAAAALGLPEADVTLAHTK
ncbi:MAG: hypothetical protein RL701_49 [Pseudomonadota bacterium]